jgi:hypothetical protein
MTKEQKARNSFNYACKQAGKCRHERYQISCFSCPLYSTCDIQARLEKARLKM